MRNLIITRNKTIIGCASTLHVYITDPNGHDLTIHGIPCRKLGTLKNGETAYFPIDNTSSRVYVVADKPGEDISCEYCDLLPGHRDIFLQGKCLFDPINGNPFHFQGNTAAPKAKMGKRIFISLLCVLGIALGITLGSAIPHWLQEKELAQPQVFTAAGMQITLTKDFKPVDATDQGFTLCYTSRDTALYIIKEDFSLSSDFKNLTLENYAQLVLSNSTSASGATPMYEEGLVIYEYTEYNYADNSEYSYLMVFLKGPDAFWIFEFSTKVSNADAMRQTYLDYAKTICFPNAAI